MATDENDQPMGGTVYYLGVIDILTPYNAVKKMEHIWKGLKDDIVSLPSTAVLFSFLYIPLELCRAAN